MTHFDAETIRRAERAVLHVLLRNALEKRATEDVLLYDAEGRPLLKGSEQWDAGQVEWRRRLHQLLDDLLDKLPSGTIPVSADELADALGELSQSDSKYTFNIVDGKLLLPLNLKKGNVEFRGHIPVYHLLAILTAAVGGFSLLHKGRKTSEDLVQTRSISELPRFPLWRKVRLGTFRSWEEMDRARVKADIWIDRLAKAMLKHIVLAAAPTEIALVKVSVRDLGFKESPLPQLLLQGATVSEISQHAAEFGLAVVPAEVGPQLCLQYPKQMDIVHIAMEPMEGLVFLLEQHHQERMLSAAFGSPNNVWGLEFQCVFSPRP